MKNPATSLQAIEPGSVIGGCKMVRLIGRGGMGAVYEAHQISLDRKVAVKVFKPTENVDDQTLRDRLFREARLVAKLNHPNIVQVFDVGEDRGISYMVMEYVEGVTLHDLLNRDSTFPIDRIVRIAIKVSRGLAAAHERRIVHQDIKPENILLASGGEVKITDFGAAGLFRNEFNPDETVFGTPLYMAPEILLGKSFDGRVDVYALGLVIYRALAGRHPFLRKQCQQVLEAQIHEPLPPLASFRPEVPPGLVRLIERICAKEPHERLTSEEVLRAFEANPEWEWNVAAPRRGDSLLRERPGAKRDAAAAAPTPPGKLDRVGLRDCVTPRPGAGFAPAPAAGAEKPAPTRKSSGSRSFLDAGLRRERKRAPTAELTAPDEAVADRADIAAATTPEPRRRQAPAAPPAAPPAAKSAAPAAATPAARSGAPAVEPPKAPPAASSAATPAAAAAAAAAAPAAAPVPAAAEPGPEAGDAGVPRSQELCIKARYHLMRKDWKRAEEIFRSALDLDPLNPTALLGLARLHVDQSRPAEAIALLRKALTAGRVNTRSILESQFFAGLKGNKDFRRLMAEHLV